MAIENGTNNRDLSEYRIEHLILFSPVHSMDLAVAILWETYANVAPTSQTSAKTKLEMVLPLQDTICTSWIQALSVFDITVCQPFIAVFDW